MEDWIEVSEEIVNSVKELKRINERLTFLVSPSGLEGKDWEEYHSLMDKRCDLNQFLLKSSSEILTPGTLIELENRKNPVNRKRILIGHCAWGSDDHMPQYGDSDPFYSEQLEWEDIKRYKKVLDF